MNLIVDAWIPVRLLTGGEPQIITLQMLCCSQDKWTLNLPRDDMELAALQLLVSLMQVMGTPQNDAELRQRVLHPLIEDEFLAMSVSWQDIFRLDHPETPFMQVKGVAAKEPTPMDKLLTGLSGATNCAFVNQPNQGEALCGGCTAIALFNQANNAPGFGGGFKSGLRGGTPITTLIKGGDLRSTLWLNVLTQPRLNKLLPAEVKAEYQPTWLKPVLEGESIPASAIGVVRGLFWQPAHIELCPPVGLGQCTGCGHQSHQRYAGFLKAKFNFTIKGLWPHPHSPRLLSTKNGVVEEKFLAFTTVAPSWTQISRLVVDKFTQQGEGHRVAAVVEQIREIHSGPLVLIIGGYRNNQASILERRHDVLKFNTDWQNNLNVLNEVVDIGLNYKTALRKALYTFVEGAKNSDVKGAGVALHEVAERDYFRYSELLIPELLASINYLQAAELMACLRSKLRKLCELLFIQATEPYVHHPKFARTLAISRAALYKHLNALQPQGGLTHAE